MVNEVDTVEQSACVFWKTRAWCPPCSPCAGDRLAADENPGNIEKRGKLMCPDALTALI